MCLKNNGCPQTCLCVFLGFSRVVLSEIHPKKKSSARFIRTEDFSFTQTHF